MRSISSFNADERKYTNTNTNTNIANILAFCHVDFNKDILESFPLHYAQHNVDKLLTYFRNKYNNHTIHLIGR